MHEFTQKFINGEDVPEVYAKIIRGLIHDAALAEELIPTEELEAFAEAQRRK
jgi:hypothetical protein